MIESAIVNKVRRRSNSQISDLSRRRYAIAELKERYVTYVDVDKIINPDTLLHNEKRNLVITKRILFNVLMQYLVLHNNND